MPFTPAHPAAVLPLRRLWPSLPVAALAAGAVAPDVEYLLRLAPRGTFGHSPLGLVAFCLPVGLAGWAAWTHLVAPALRGGPPGIADAERRDGESAVGLAFLCAAVLLGAATHVAWDAFTHATGAGVRLLPALADPLPLPGRWPAYRLLQHASTLLGGIVVARAAIPAARDALRRGSPRMRRRAGNAVAAAAAGAAVLALVAGVPAWDARPGVLVGRLVVGGMAGAVVGVLAWSAAVRLRTR